MMNYESVKTIRQLVQESGKVYENEVFLRTLRDDVVHDTTFGQFAVECEAVAVWTARKTQTLGRAVRVAILSTNSPLYVRMALGIMTGGGVSVLLDPQASEDVICACLNKAEADILLWEPKLAPNIESIRARCPKLSLTIQMAEGALPEACGGIFTTYAGQKEDICVEEKDCAVIIFTSGTTGEEKGVMLSHGNLANTVFCANHAKHTTKVNVLPMHHAYCLYADFLMSLSNCTTICMNGDMKNLADNLLRFNPHSVNVVPMIAQALYTRMVMLADKEGKTISEVKNRVLGNRMERIPAAGAHLPEELVGKYAQIGVFLCQGYGMTECGPAISSPDMSRPDKAHTAGRVVLRCKTRVVDGELQVSSPSVMMGYVNAPELTAEVITEDGWLRTGDIGYEDEEGFLHITGRKKNLIILANGENVSPEQIENLLLDHQLVEECLVYGEGNIIVAEIYPNSKYMKLHGITDALSAVAEVVQSVNAQLPSHKKIAKHLVRITPFKKTGSNKIIRSQRAPKDAILSCAAQGTRMPENEIQQRIFDCIAEGLGHRDFGIDTDIFSAGMDSLGSILTLKMFLDEMNFSVELDELMMYTTVEKLEVLYKKKQNEAPIDLSPLPVYPLIDVQTFFAYVMRGNTTSNIPFLFKLHESVDLHRMQEAILKLFDIHPILRNVIQPAPEGYYVSIRDDSRPVNIPIYTLTQDQWEERKGTLIRPYLYTKGEPLYHIELCDVEGDKYLFFDIAHVISDGVTLSILLDNLNSLYLGKHIEKESYSFYEYIREERYNFETGRHTPNIQYFMDLLGDMRLDRTILNRPGKQDLSKGDNAALHGIFTRIDKEKMQKISHKYNVSDNVVFLTAFNQCIRIFSDRDDTLSTSIHNGRTDSRWARLVGCLFVTYNYRHTFSDQETLEEMFRSSGRQIMETMCSHIHTLHADEMFIQYQGDLFSLSEIGGAPAQMVPMQLDSLPFHLMVHSANGGYFYELRYWENRFEQQQLTVFMEAMDAILGAMAEEEVVGNLRSYLPAHLFPADTKHQILDRMGRIQPIGGWGELYVDGKPAGRTARILPDGTVDDLETSGRYVMNEGLMGRLYPDQVKLEKMLLTYPGVKEADAYISLGEKNYFMLTINVVADQTVTKQDLLAFIAADGDQSIVPPKVIINGAEV